MTLNELRGKVLHHVANTPTGKEVTVAQAHEIVGACITYLGLSISDDGTLVPGAALLRDHMNRPCPKGFTCVHEVLCPGAVR